MKGKVRIYIYSYDKKRKHNYEKILGTLLDRTQINSENIDDGISQLNDILLRGRGNLTLLKG